MQHRVLLSVASQSDAIHHIYCCAMITQLQTWSHKIVCSIIWFLLSKYVFSTEIYCQFTDVMAMAYQESSMS